MNLAGIIPVLAAPVLPTQAIVRLSPLYSSDRPLCSTATDPWQAGSLFNLTPSLPGCRQGFTEGRHIRVLKLGGNEFSRNQTLIPASGGQQVPIRIFVLKDFHHRPGLMNKEIPQLSPTTQGRTPVLRLAVIACRGKKGVGILHQWRRATRIRCQATHPIPGHIGATGGQQQKNQGKKREKSIHSRLIHRMRWEKWLHTWNFDSRQEAIADIICLLREGHSIPKAHRNQGADLTFLTPT